MVLLNRISRAHFYGPSANTEGSFEISHFPTIHWHSLPVKTRSQKENGLVFLELEWFLNTM